MANEVLLSSIQHKTDDISMAIAAELVENVVALPLIYTENTPEGTNVKKFRKDDFLTAEAVAEAATYTFSGSSDITQTASTATATKLAVASKLTVEAEEFTTFNIAQLAAKQGGALARLVDDQIVALYTAFTNEIVATTTLTVDDFLDSIYTVHNALAGGSRPLVSVVEFKGANELKKVLAASGSSIFTMQNMTSLLGDSFVASNGFVGNLPGGSIFATTGLPTDTGDDVGLTYNPDVAMAGLVSPGVRTQVSWKGSEGAYWEVYSYLFFDAVEWREEGGCKLRSDS